MKNGVSEWIPVGEISVDAGIVMIGDPCYTFPDDGSSRKDLGGGDWLKFCDKLAKADSTGVGIMNFGITAVVASSGLGDGLYTVYAKYIDMGTWGTRVKEIKVVFIDDEEADEESE